MNPNESPNVRSLFSVKAKGIAAARTADLRLLLKDPDSLVFFISMPSYVCRDGVGGRLLDFHPPVSHVLVVPTGTVKAAEVTSYQK
jgi:hypothetical protein